MSGFFKRAALRSISKFDFVFSRSVQKRSYFVLNSKQRPINYEITAQDLRSLETKIENFNIRISQKCKKRDSSVETEIIDHVGVILFETLNSKTNIVNTDMVLKLVKALADLNTNPDVDVILLRSKKPKSFFAGADIDLFDHIDFDSTLELSELFQSFIKGLINSKKTVALVEGHCLGAGLEIVLACNHCVSTKSDSVEFGFPEAKLGFIPGGLGTYLLMSRAHVVAPHMLKTGARLDSFAASKAGIVDHVVDPILINQSNQITKVLEFANLSSRPNVVNNSLNATLNKINEKLRYSSKFHWMKIKNKIFHLWCKINYPIFRNEIIKNGENFPFYGELIKLIELYHQTNAGRYHLPDVYCSYEAQLFAHLVHSNYSKKIRSFSSKTKMIKKVASDFKHDHPIDSSPGFQLRNIGIIGAVGQMGQGITKLSLKNQLSTTLMDRNIASVIEFQDHLIKNVFNMTEKDYRFKIFDNPDFPTINTIENLSDFKDSQMIIDCTSEDLDKKQQLFQSLKEAVPPGCVLATTTSAITLKEITKNLKNAENVIGLHYFNPFDKMKTVEVVLGDNTSKLAIATAQQLLMSHNKLPIFVKDSPGFFGTRVLASAVAEVLELYEECYTVYDVDYELRRFGFPQDISELIDSIGIDTCNSIYKYLRDRFGDKFSTYNRRNVFDHLIDNNCFGLKSCEGINKYSSTGERSSLRIPGYNFNEFFRLSKYYEDPSTDYETISERVVFRMLNECCRCLEEQVIDSPQAGDVLATYGFGFPIYYSGPFSYIDEMTPQVFLQRLQKLYETRNVPAFEPCKLIVDMAQNDKRFYPSSEIIT